MPEGFVYSIWAVYYKIGVSFSLLIKVKLIILTLFDFFCLFLFSFIFEVDLELDFLIFLFLCLLCFHFHFFLDTVKCNVSEKTLLAYSHLEKFVFCFFDWFLFELINLLNGKRKFFLKSADFLLFFKSRQSQ